jgi:signal transduction histidine kinase
VTSWSRWSAGRSIVRRESIALGVVIALVGALSVGLLAASRGRERRAQLAGEASRRVADLVATVASVQADERAMVIAETAGQPVSQSQTGTIVVQDLAAIRSSLDGSRWATALVDTLDDAAHAALAACDTVIIRETRHEPADIVRDADRAAAYEVTRVRGEAATVARAAAGRLDTSVEAAERVHVFGVVTLSAATTFAIAMGLVVSARLTAAARSEAAARSRAEEANRAKSLFLASMSHELRTPLNAIMGFADLLTAGVRGELTPVQTDDVRRIRRAAKHLLALITDVLHFARLEATRAANMGELVAIDGVVSVAGGMIAAQAREKGIELVCHSCDPTLAARANREKVLQIVLNLLTNAVKFTPSGGRVVLSCGRSRDPANRDTVWIMICDTGRGIPAAMLDRIFEPFVQVGSDTATEVEGVGLGLAISRTLARAMHGDVFAQSEEGMGAQFMLVLPLEAMSADETPRGDP